MFGLQNDPEHCADRWNTGRGDGSSEACGHSFDEVKAKPDASMNMVARALNPVERVEHQGEVVWGNANSFV